MTARGVALLVLHIAASVFVYAGTSLVAPKGLNNLAQGKRSASVDCGRQRHTNPVRVE